MAIKYSNNASTLLNGAITSSATSIVVDDVSDMPILTSSDHTYLTLTNLAASKIEVIKVTAINTATKTLTAVRGQDNTTAQAFNDNDICELRLTAALLNDAASRDDDPAGTAVAMAIALG